MRAPTQSAPDRQSTWSVAVKPQVLPRVFGEIKDVVTKDQVIISIAAGYTISDLTEGLGGQVRVRPLHAQHTGYGG